MADARFFQCAGPFSLAEIAQRVGAQLGDPDAGPLMIADLATLDAAVPSDLSLFAEPRHRVAYEATEAGAVLTTRALVAAGPAVGALLLSEQPRHAYVAVARLFYPQDAPERVMIGVGHPRATVAADAILGADCQLAPGAVIGAGARLGSRCRIGANAVIGQGVVLGDDCVVGDGASISHALIGNAVEIYPGARIGAPGFGFVAGRDGPLRVPQLGRVVIGDHVEIGANSAVDRGTLGDTMIGRGTVIDNLVQVAHNVRIGVSCVIAAQVGIAGSASIGDGVMIGGQVAIADHLAIGAGARIAARSGVMRDVAPGETVGGAPALPIRQWHRQTAALAQLARRTRPRGSAGEA